MTHYICRGGCKGVAEVPGTCQATECLSHGKPLEPCNCRDGKHSVAEKEDSSQDSNEETI